MQEDDTESVEPAARRDQDSLLARSIRTGWGDMCMDLIQTIQEVFDHAIFQ